MPAKYSTTPRLKTVAKALDVDPDDLERLITAHPEPTPERVAAAGVCDVSPEELDRRTRDRVAAWIDRRKNKQRRTPKDELYEYLEANGPVRREQIARDAEDLPWFANAWVPTLLMRLESDGCIDREVRGDPLDAHPSKWIYRAVRPPENYHPVD